MAHEHKHCRCMEPDPLTEDQKQAAADLLSRLYAKPSSKETALEVLEKLRRERDNG